MNLETHLPVVADSWEQLRPCDLYRLIDSALHQYGDLSAICAYITKRRPDLSRRVKDAAEEIAEDLADAGFELTREPEPPARKPIAENNPAKPVKSLFPGSHECLPGQSDLF